MTINLQQRRTIHSIVQIPILEGPIGTSLPFLFTEGGNLSRLALAWARSKMLEEQASSATVADGVAALGRFLDFFQLVHKTSMDDTRQLLLALKRFYAARRYGCSQLGWQATRESTAATDVRLVSEFSDWAAENFFGNAINPVSEKPLEQLSGSERRALEQRLAAKKKWDFFAHLAAATREGKVSLLARSFSPPRRRRRTTGTKHFPPDKIDALITATPSLRDRLFFLLLFYGGVRISEPLHLFTRDVSIRPDGIARVVLAHPQDGAFNWIDAARQRRSGTRIDYLADRYRLGPRNLLAEDHPLHAGWKGILLEDTSRSESEVHWIDESKGRLFATYHALYVERFRAHMPDNHPYYFCNFASKTGFGKPLKLSNIVKSFYRAASRVGLSPTDEGVHPHGARHYYGYYCASVLRLAIEVAQRLMHHEQISSTEEYYGLTDQVVRKELQKAQAKQRQVHVPQR